MSISEIIDFGTYNWLQIITEKWSKYSFGLTMSPLNLFHWSIENSIWNQYGELIMANQNTTCLREFKINKRIQLTNHYLFHEFTMNQWSISRNESTIYFLKSLLFQYVFCKLTSKNNLLRESTINPLFVLSIHYQ